MIELLLVVGIVGVLGSIALPRLGRVREGAALRSAKQGAGAVFHAARSTAVRQARPVRAQLDAESLWTQVDTGRVSSRFARVGETIRWSSLRVAVATDPALDSVLFDRRGMGRVFTGGTNTAARSSVVLRLRRSATRDSLCITPIGSVSPCGI